MEFLVPVLPDDQEIVSPKQREAPIFAVVILLQVVGSVSSVHLIHVRLHTREQGVTNGSSEAGQHTGIAIFGATGLEESGRVFAEGLCHEASP